MPDAYDPNGPQAEAARTLHVLGPLRPHTYMERPSQFTPERGPGVASEEHVMALREASERFDAVVAALWDGFVSTIRAGRYADLHLLRSALQERRTPYRKGILRLDLAKTYTSAAHVELRRVLERWGGAVPLDGPATVAELGPAARAPHTLREVLVPGVTDVDDNETFHSYAQAGWGSWHMTSAELVITSSTSDEEVAEREGRANRPTEFHLRPPFSPSHVGLGRSGELERVGLDARTVWDEFEGFFFNPDDTFAKAHDRVEEWWKPFEADRSVYKDLVEIINLRLSILSVVLYEHEIYGHVPIWGEMTPEGRAALTRPPPETPPGAGRPRESDPDDTWRWWLGLQEDPRCRDKAGKFVAVWAYRIIAARHNEAAGRPVIDAETVRKRVRERLKKAGETE